MNLEDIKYIKVRAGVRYWNDTEVNGEEDVDLMEISKDSEITEPRMPFAYPTGCETFIAPNGEYDWVITIDALSGNIVNWPKGNVANIFYKTCDDNTITLIGENNEVLGKYNCYVPDFLCIGDEGYGDYIEFIIESDGHIRNFKFGDEDVKQLEEKSFK